MTLENCRPLSLFPQVLRLYPPAPATMRTMQSPLTLPLGPDGRSLCVPAGVSVVIPIWYTNCTTTLIYHSSSDRTRIKNIVNVIWPFSNMFPILFDV